MSSLNPPAVPPLQPPQPHNQKKKSPTKTPSEEIYWKSKRQSEGRCSVNLDGGGGDIFKWMDVGGGAAGEKRSTEPDYYQREEV